MPKASHYFFDTALGDWEDTPAGETDSSSSGFLDHWFAKDNSLPKSHFLVIARRMLREWESREGEFQRLDEFLKGFSNPARSKKLQAQVRIHYFVHSDSIAGWLVPRVLAQLRALVHGILSAYYFRRWQATKGKKSPPDTESKEFARHALASAEAYREALRLPSPVWSGETYPYTGLYEPGTPLALLAEEVKSQPDKVNQPGQTWCASAIWMWLRLVTYLLEAELPPLVEPEAPNVSFAKPVEFQTQGRALWARVGTDDPGEVSPVAVQLRSEGPETFYWDSVALGLLALDDGFLDSVLNAWRLLTNETDWKQQTARTLRIALVRTKNIQDLASLGGASAGALVGCAMYAASHRMSMNQDASVTAKVVDDCGDLAAIDGLVSKLKAAAAAQITTVVVSTKQRAVESFQHLDELRKRAADHGVPNLVEAESIAAALPHLLGDHRCENVLREYAEKKRQEWGELREKHDHLERLDHFVDQRYSLLPQGTTPFLKAEYEARPPSTLHFGPVGYQPVDGQGDDALVKLLKETPWLLLCEDSGAGKTVFTKRALAWFSEKETWGQISGGKPLLAIRWEKTWPTLDREKSTPKFEQLMAEELAKVLNRQVTDMLPIARYAIAHHRLCLILDAMDQAEPGEIANLDNFLKEMACPITMTRAAWAGCGDENPAGKIPVRLIVTSREFKISEFSPFREGQQWCFAKVELFTPDQRRYYIRDLPERLVQTLLPNESLFSPALTPDREPDLLAFPEVLRLLRVAIEEALAPDALQRLRNQPPSNPTETEITDAAQRLRPIQSRADLYQLVSATLIESALDKLPNEVKRSHPNSREQRERLREMLAAIAFAMQLAECYHGDVPVGLRTVQSIEATASSLCSNEVWRKCKQLMQHTEFTERLLLSGDGRSALGFRTRKAMEFHAAAHLAHFSNERTWNLMRAWRPGRRFQNLEANAHVTDDDHGTRSANNADDWREIWLIVLELAHHEDREWVSPTVSYTSRSLAHLFERPAGGRRPSELMYRAWILFQKHPSFRESGAKILASFQSEASDLLNDDSLWNEKIPRGEPGAEMHSANWTVAQLVATLVPEHCVQDLIETGKLTAERWKEIAPPGWSWFYPSSTVDPNLALKQLEAWKEKEYPEHWIDPSTGRENVFKYEDRAFVCCPPPDHLDRLRDSLTKQGIWSPDEIEARIAERRADPRSYMRGSHDEYRQANKPADVNERPRHVVRFTQPFYIQSTTVTLSQFKLFDRSVQDRQQPDAPVVDVTWWDSFLFAQWCRGLALGAELPTEAQWEFAARAGRDFAGSVGSLRPRRDEAYGISPFTFISSRHANIDSETLRLLPGRWNSARRALSSTASKKQQVSDQSQMLEPCVTNQWGIWQAHGNVWEWCLDEFHADEYRQYRDSPAIDPARTSDDVAALRVMRGGDCRSSAIDCRSAVRHQIPPDARGTISLRLVVN